MPEHSSLLDAVANFRRARSLAIRAQGTADYIQYLRQYRDALNDLAIVAETWRDAANRRVTQLEAERIRR